MKYSDEEIKKMFQNWATPSESHHQLFIAAMEHKIRAQYKKKLILVSAIWFVVFTLIAFITPALSSFLIPMALKLGLNSFSLGLMILAGLFAAVQIGELGFIFSNLVGKTSKLKRAI